MAENQTKMDSSSETAFMIPHSRNSDMDTTFSDKEPVDRKVEMELLSRRFAKAPLIHHS